METNKTTNNRTLQEMGKDQPLASAEADQPPHERSSLVGWTPSQFLPRDYAIMRERRNEASNTSANETNKQKSLREYKLGEEIANSITHGIGALLSIAALVVLILTALDKGGGLYLFAGLVYGITMLIEYIMSTLYHALAAEQAKKVFKVLDHSGIYLFIAGSYTPFCLITLQNDGGIGLCLFVWAIGFAGVACEAFWVFRPRWISVVLYLLMGWCVVWYSPVLATLIDPTGLWLLVGGGICYSLGCIFYVLKKIPYMHSIFHLWVLAGSAMHFVAIVFYVM